MATRSREHVSTFAELVEARSTALLRLAYAVVGDHQLAQDLLQEALVKVYVAWPRLRDVSGAEAYARRTIVTTAISWRLKQCPRPPGVEGFRQDNANGPITRDPGEPLDARWDDERLTDPVHGRRPATAYSFHVARADNVLLVFEDTDVDDRGPFILGSAVRTALPQYHAGTVVPGGEPIAGHPFYFKPFFGVKPYGGLARQSGWPPRLTHCVADPRTWGAATAQGATFVPKHHQRH